MCTALSLAAGGHFFGRNLDVERSYGEQVIVTPRRFPLSFRHAGLSGVHHALIGMGALHGGCPLYFDAANEHGLCMASLAFPGCAAYFPAAPGEDTIAPFELIPWVLSQCSSLVDARGLLTRVRLIDEPFAPDLPLTPLHWLLADASGALVIESTEEGLRLTDNPLRVLTNSPPIDYHLQHINSCISLTRDPPQSRFAPGVALRRCSLGMGAIGLPGDMSSMSRFARAAFILHNSEFGQEESTVVSRFFHVLDCVAQPFGVTRMESGEFEYTLYSSCIDASRGVYYYKTHLCSRIAAVCLHRADPGGSRLSVYPLVSSPQFLAQN